MHKDETFGDMMRQAREKARLTLREAAGRIGTGYGHLCQIERGQHVNVTASMLLRAQEVYGFSDRRLLASVRESLWRSTRS